MGHTILLHWLQKGREVTSDNVTYPPVVKSLNCILTVKLVSKYHLILCLVTEEEWGRGTENRNDG